MRIETPSTALANIRCSQSEVHETFAECPRCNRGSRVAVMPWSPQVAKVLCRWCDETFEVKVRDSRYDAIEEHVAIQDDKAKTGKRRSVNVEMNDRIRKEMAALREKRLREMPRVRTKLGDAVLIG